MTDPNRCPVTEDYRMFKQPMDPFERALQLLLAHEGGLVDDPDDRGGRTNYGVTHATYDGYRKREGLGVQPVDRITGDEVRAIYKRSYWDACRCDELPWRLAYPTFDAAVNSGPSRAIEWLQGGLGVAQDGIIGPVTFAAANRSDEGAAFAVCRERMDYIVELVRRDRSQLKFLKGWARRILDVAKEVVV